MERSPTRRAVPLVVGWVVAAVAALGVASWGVALVGRSVTDRRPAPLTAAQVDARLTDLSTTTTETTETTDATSTSTTSTTTDPGDASVSTTSTTQAGTPTTAAPSTTAAPAVTRAYSVQGGSVTLRFEPGRVSVVFANPAPGFDVEFESEHVNGLRVEFESEHHRSRVDGWWDGGPQDRVTEEARSDESESESESD